MPQKTIEDYRQLIKLLKLKILRLEEDLVSLKRVSKDLPKQFEVAAPAQPAKAALQKIQALRAASTLEQKAGLIQATQKLAQSLGFSLEYIFRRADREYQGSCETRVFVHYLISMLRVSNPVELALLFDQDRNGKVTQQQFLVILNCYMAADRPNPRVMQKLAATLAIQVRFDDAPPPPEVELFANYIRNQALSKTLKDYEIYGMYSHLFQDGELDKQRLQSLQAAQACIAINLSSVLQIESQSRSYNPIANDIFSEFQKITAQEGKRIMEVLTRKGLQLSDLIDSFLETKPEGHNSVFTLSRLHTHMRVKYPYFSRNQILLLFSVIDREGTGSFGIVQLLHFYLTYRSEEDSLLTAASLLANMIFAAKLTPESFLKLIGLEESILKWEDLSFFLQVFMDYDVAVLKPIFDYLHRRSVLCVKGQAPSQNPGILKHEFINKCRRFCPHFQPKKRTLVEDFQFYMRQYIKQKGDIITALLGRGSFPTRSNKQMLHPPEPSNKSISFSANKSEHQSPSPSKQEFKQQEYKEFDPAQLQI